VNFTLECCIWFPLRIREVVLRILEGKHPLTMRHVGETWQA
jgi:hypothetical protein